MVFYLPYIIIVRFTHVTYSNLFLLCCCAAFHCVTIFKLIHPFSRVNIGVFSPFGTFMSNANRNILVHVFQ